MADHFDSPQRCDDGEFRTIRYRDVVPEDHPVRFIERFVAGLDVRSFEQRYKVGDGLRGRAPKDVRLMLSVVLYALYCRLYSARRIDYATEHFADFWFFTHGQRISHDKISDFVCAHEDDIHRVFLATINLAHHNHLLDFKGLYQDGFMLRANASRKRSITMGVLNKQEKKLSDALDGVLAGLKSAQADESLLQRKDSLATKLQRIAELQEVLDRKIAQRAAGKAPWKLKDLQTHTTVNPTDSDSDIMRQKDCSVANSYLKVNAVDGKQGIVVASAVAGYNDEPHMAQGLLTDANRNCEQHGQYRTVVADCNFTTAENCDAFEQQQVALIGPTREAQAQQCSNQPDAITFTYDVHQQCVRCSQGAMLLQRERYFDKYKNTTILGFSNKEACAACARRDQCTKSKAGYRNVRMDERFPAQQRVLQRYQSPQGQELYKRRSHVAETPQGDLKHNGRFTQLLRRGLHKVRVDATLQDIVWNLRRIYNIKGPAVAWAL